MESLWHDVKFAVRLLIKERGFTAITLATLALCIGANTAVFSVLHAVLVKPLPFPEPSRLVAMFNSYPKAAPGLGPNSYVDFYDRRALTDVFDDVAIFGHSGFVIGDDGAPERVDGLRVSPSFFRVLGLPPLMGRLFEEEEMVPERDHVVILSEGLWRRAYGADPHILGRDILLNGESNRVVGIMPASFAYLRTRAELWVVLAPTAEQRDVRMKHANAWQMIARLRNDVSVAQAQERIDRLNAEVLDRSPEFRDMAVNAGYHTVVSDLLEAATRTVRLPLLLVQAGVALVLVIGCVNVANLTLSRANVRLREVAIRFSLGAGRHRVLRQLLTESVVLALVGGVLGVIVGLWGLDAIHHLWAERLPRATGFGLGLPVFIFAAVISAATGIAAGILPALQLSRADLTRVVNPNTRTDSTAPSSISLRNMLVVVQVALAFVLLIGAGLLIRSFRAVLSVDPGFTAAHVHTATINLPRLRYDSNDKIVSFIDRLVPRAASLPGVASAAVVTSLPFGTSRQRSVFIIDGYRPSPGESPPAPYVNRVDESFFSTLGIALLRGRFFGAADTEHAPLVAVVDRTLADRYWPGEDPIGRTLVENMGARDEDRRFTIVGVVNPVTMTDLADPLTDGAIYLSIRQDPQRGFSLVLRLQPEAGPINRSLRNEVLQLDPQIPVHDQMLLEERMSASLVNRRTPMVLLQFFAAVALLLAAIGVYGVLSYSVVQRRREIGIRLAIGARAREVTALVMRRGLALIGLGLVAGALLAAVLTKLVAALLFGVGRFDPVTIAAVLGMVGTIGLIACYVPAMRATRMSPLEILREE